MNYKEWDYFLILFFIVFNLNLINVISCILEIDRMNYIFCLLN